MVSTGDFDDGVLSLVDSMFVLSGSVVNHHDLQGGSKRCTSMFCREVSCPSGHLELSSISFEFGVLSKLEAFD